MQIIDVTGQTFGRLTVVGRTHVAGRTLWACECTCGGNKVTRGIDLRSGVVKSCGCLKNQAKPKRRVDLTGQKFGKLTAISFAGMRGKRTTWNCECLCGNTVVGVTSQLRSGKARSCGCLIGRRTQPLRDLTGQKFGELTVTSLVRFATKWQSEWNCICSCNTTVIKTHACLRDNGRKSDGRKDTILSCGCRHNYYTSTPEEKKMAEITARLRKRLHCTLRHKGVRKNNKTFELFGYTKQQAYAHINALLRPGMTWENRRLWHIDHIKPLKSATTLEEVIKLFALDNLQVLWYWENISKSDYSMAEWEARKQKVAHTIQPASYRHSESPT